MNKLLLLAFSITLFQALVYAQPGEEKNDSFANLMTDFETPKISTDGEIPLSVNEFAVEPKKRIQAKQSKKNKRFEFFVGFVADKVETEKFKDFSSFAGISAGQIPSNFQATPEQLETGFKDAFKTSEYLKGVNVSGSYYINKNFALVTDFSITTNKSNRQTPDNPIFFEDSSEAKRTQYTFLGGGQWKYRKKKVEPFIRGMIGATRNNNQISLSISNTGEESFRLKDNYTAFALSVGGGLDIRINKRFALRVIQFDYIPTFSRSRNVNLTAPIQNGTDQFDLGLTSFRNTTRNRFRFGAGIVFR